MAVKDLTGKHFGYLTVIERDKDHISKSGRIRTKWKCRCEFDNCGNIISVLSTNLIQGTTISCGCYREKVNQFKKKNNVYDLTTYNYGIGFTSKGQIFYFDLEDYELIKNYCWYINDQGYLLAHEGDKNIRMHRLILNAPEDYEVDHIHGKNSRNDNRKSNLRLVTHTQNNWNKDKYITNTSGYRGVCWDNSHQKWLAQIKCNGEKVHLGLFDDIEEAYKARLKAEEKYFGEFSYDNSMNLGETN